MGACVFRPALSGLLIWLVSTLPVAALATGDPSAPDTTTTEVSALVVTAAGAGLSGPGKWVLSAPALTWRDPGSLFDLGPLMPSVQTSVNSRGEGHFLIRGAPERHVQIFLDDIPLNVAWDERVDLETIPVAGGSRLEATRGLTTLLDGPGMLAGSVRLLPAAAVANPSTRVLAGGGAYGSGRVNIEHARRSGRWDLQGSGGWLGRDGTPLPRGVIDPLGGERRFNSDLSQYSFLARASRPVAGTGRWSLLGAAWSAEKGVPPELHLGSEARFWRYPLQERAIVGTSLRLPLDAAGRWDLGAVVAADFFRQEIDPRGPDRWGAPHVVGEDYEVDSDRTGTARLRLDHWLGADSRLSMLATARYAHHRESLTVAGPTVRYAQWLNAVVAEADLAIGGPWRLRAGVGGDQAATPEAGDKSRNPTNTAPCVNLRATHAIGRNTEIHAGLSRRSRFPSLREAYSGALGRFVDNPDLGPERQDLIEVGVQTRGTTWHLETAAFRQTLSDGIDRISLPNRQYQRVNRSRIRVPGIEAAGGWTPVAALDFTVQHTVLAARVLEDGVSGPAEDRPDWLSRASVGWEMSDDWAARLEMQAIGSRWSADPNAEAGMRRLAPGATWNLRVAWRPGGLRSPWEWHGRLANAFDQHVDYQTGLPGPGRQVSGGAAYSF